MNRAEELRKGCGKDFCGELIFYKDTSVVDTLCIKCKSELKGYLQAIDDFLKRCYELSREDSTLNVSYYQIAKQLKGEKE